MSHCLNILGVNMADAVKTAIETMTGLSVGEVNIRVASIVVGKSQQPAEKE